MSDPTKKTLQDLYAWSDRLTDDWLGLGERLRRYADAWKAHVDELRAEVERLTQADAAARGDIEMLYQSREVLQREIERRRAQVERLCAAVVRLSASEPNTPGPQS